jgi:glycerophosphoryl diester phosphodiesterase
MLLYGHRGAKGEAPENTIEGFKYGLELGLRAFEIDVRLTADGEIVLLHDATVDRTTNGTGALADLTLAQALELDARDTFADWPAPCRIPRLKELLALLPVGFALEVELKRDTPERLARLASRLTETLAPYTAALNFTVSSFEPEALRLMRQHAPQLPRAFIGAYDTPEFLETARELECTQADIPLKTGTLEVVQAAHDAGLRVTGWPGDTVEQLDILVNEWQVEGITTNFPALALDYLG